MTEDEICEGVQAILTGFNGTRSVESLEEHLAAPGSEPEPGGGHPSGADQDSISRGSPELFLGREGLDVTAMVGHVRAQGPIAVAVDGRLWSYRGGVWRPDGSGEVGRRVRDALGSRFRPAHLTNVISWFSQDPATITAGPLTGYINCTNGLLAWRTMVLGSHRPDLPSTVQLPVAWNPRATCPAIDGFLADTVPEDAISFIHELVGYIVLSGNPLHRVPLLLGPGGSGKGTMLRLIIALVGQANAANVTPHQIADSRFAAATLFGKLVNVAGDLDSSLIERTDTFKMVTGGDTISGEHKYSQPFSFAPWATHVFSANEPPVSRDTTSGWYRRWLPVPFTNVVPIERRLPEHRLDARLHRTTELEGLLVHAVTGLQRLMDRGRFEEPGSVVAESERFRAATDSAAGFIDACIDKDPTCWLTRKDIWERYEQWAKDNHRGMFAAGKFYDRLQAAGISEGKNHGDRGFRCGKGEGW